MPEPVFRRILVATDFSAQSENAWGLARRLAGAVGAEVVLLHVFVPPPPPVEAPLPPDYAEEVYEGSRKWVEQQLEAWAAAARAEGLTATTFFRTGVAHRDIVDTAREVQADLIAIGTHGRGGVERLLLGSVADRVIRLADCPVLAIRQPDPD